MNILLLTNYDFPSHLAVNILLSQFPKHWRVDLYYSRAVGAPNSSSQPLQLLNDFDQRCIKQYSRERCKKTDIYPFDQLPYSTVNTVTAINTIAADVIADWCQLGVDIVVSIRFGMIIKDEAIQQLKVPIINLHSGLLPQYRGVMASFWVLYNGEHECGTSLHTIDNGQIDEGVLIEQTRSRVGKYSSYFTTVISLYPEAIEVLDKKLHEFEQMGSEVFCTDRQLSTKGLDNRYYTYPTDAQFIDFEKRGYRLFCEHEFDQWIAALPRL